MGGQNKQGNLVTPRKDSTFFLSLFVLDSLKLLTLSARVSEPVIKYLQKDLILFPNSIRNYTTALWSS